MRAGEGRRRLAKGLVLFLSSAPAFAREASEGWQAKRYCLMQSE
jgi:hypothetical protein